VVVVENNSALEMSKYARFRGLEGGWWRPAIALENKQTCSFSMACGRWWRWRTTTALENEQMCSLPRRWKVVVVENSHRPRKKANVLVFDGLWKVVAVENNHCPRKQANMLISKGLEGGD